ncbi:hypothetical protein HS048_35395 [Planomonospora sp. ID91781]|nr:hypothetical protein [Planomonospora sp. ID91781]MBG0825958.1 hypothetical protein [Planomonospora sp. ID91781]
MTRVLDVLTQLLQVAGAGIGLYTTVALARRAQHRRAHPAGDERDQDE